MGPVPKGVLDLGGTVPLRGAPVFENRPPVDEAAKPVDRLISTVSDELGLPVLSIMDDEEAGKYGTGPVPRGAEGEEVGIYGNEPVPIGVLKLSNLDSVVSSGGYGASSEAGKVLDLDGTVPLRGAPVFENRPPVADLVEPFESVSGVSDTSVGTEIGGYGAGPLIVATIDDISSVPDRGAPELLKRPDEGVTRPDAALTPPPDVTPEVMLIDGKPEGVARGVTRPDAPLPPAPDATPEVAFTTMTPEGSAVKGVMIPDAAPPPLP